PVPVAAPAVEQPPAARAVFEEASTPIVVQKKSASVLSVLGSSKSVLDIEPVEREREERVATASTTNKDRREQFLKAGTEARQMIVLNLHAAMLDVVADVVDTTSVAGGQTSSSQNKLELVHLADVDTTVADGQTSSQKLQTVKRIIDNAPPADSHDGEQYAHAIVDADCVSSSSSSYGGDHGGGEDHGTTVMVVVDPEASKNKDNKVMNLLVNTSISGAAVAVGEEAVEKGQVPEDVVSNTANTFTSSSAGGVGDDVEGTTFSLVEEQLSPSRKSNSGAGEEVVVAGTSLSSAVVDEEEQKVAQELQATSTASVASTSKQQEARRHQPQPRTSAGKSTVEDEGVEQ
ncbi:unnamed protein product, partial [Amoebophrya sp. A25]